jgi:glucosamine--fructose-6-phosphate aminotransferase (isomerizing)
MTAMTESRMRREVLEIPAAVERLLAEGAGAIGAAARAVTGRDPAFLVTVARGSSDNAATFFKYASELLTGLPVASVGPSVASVYGRRLRLGGSVCLAISQSGRSPDIVSMARMAGEEGALTLALTNAGESDLARACAMTLDIRAGAELSVAATKTFVNSAVAALWLLGEIAGDRGLLAAIRGLPEALAEAAATRWDALAEALGAAGSLYCLGRGPGFAVSNEAALKFKETCRLHAESFSSAEVLHGPVSIVGQGFPVLALAVADAAEAGLAAVADDLAAKGATAFATSPLARQAVVLPAVRTAHPLTDPLALIVTFYAMVEEVARARGIDPDAPRHLRKVTETV